MADLLTPEVLLALETIIMLLLVIFTGFLLRRKKILDSHSTNRLSTLVVDIAFPALVFPSLLSSANPADLMGSWYVPFSGLLIILLGLGFGYLISPLIHPEQASRRGSAAFAIGIPNWIFIPLPLAAALFGMEGERIVLLFNLGALLVFWSLGILVLRDGSSPGVPLQRLLLNPGLLATLLGILVALAFPASRTLEQSNILELSPVLAAASIVVKATAFVGSITVPLSMIVTGSLLAEAGTRQAWNSRVLGISLIRLLVFPGIILLLLQLAEWIGLQIQTEVSMILVMISAMPVAVSGSIVAEKTGGDVDLISHTVFVSTLASVITVPAFVWLMRLIGY